MKAFPKIVTALTYHHDAWIVGSAADPRTDLRTVRDFDVIVPFANWPSAALHIPSKATPNRFGGWKVQLLSGQSVDIWPGDLTWLMQNEMAWWAWHPRSGVRLRKVE